MGLKWALTSGAAPVTLKTVSAVDVVAGAALRGAGALLLDQVRVLRTDCAVVLREAITFGTAGIAL